MKQFRHWLSKGVALAFGLFLVGSFSFPQAFAADACECFCGDTDLGALSSGPFDSANECAAFCADVADSFAGSELQYIGCFTNEDMYPENSNLCWTQDECTKYPVDIAGTTYYGDWGKQSAYCSKQSVTNAEMGYCYGPMLPVTLNVPIMGVTEISALGDYVNLLYEYAIPLAGIFGALMFTVAGFQYMTAGGDKGAVSKAKARMTNTISGIVFLMAVYVIAYLIDPRLTRFNELRPPLVKEAVLVDDTTTCEALDGYGYDIFPTSGACGKKGEITGDDNINLNIANPPEVGDSCTFSGCDDKSKSCVLKGDNSGGACVSCNEISDLNAAVDLEPTESICSQIATRADRRDSNENNEYICYLDNDTYLFSLSSGDRSGADECVQFYSSGKEYVDCTALQDEAEGLEDGCGAYELINADSYGIGWSGSLAEITGYGSADSIEDFASTFASLCEQDICSVASAGTTTQGSCNFVDSNFLQDFGDAFVEATLLTIFDEYGCAGGQALADARAAAEASEAEADRAREAINDAYGSSYP